MSQIASILLAAGESSRLGFPKQLISFQGELLIESLARKIVSLSLPKNICITGAHKSEIQNAVQPFQFETVHNEYYKNGMSSSIMKGVREIIMDEDIDAILITVCDQPLIPTSHYKKLIDVYLETENKIVSSKYGETYGVPAIFDRDFFQEMLSIDSGGGAKQIIKNNLKSTGFVQCEEASFDIDTPENYEALKKLDT